MDILEEKLAALDARRGKRKAIAVSEYCKRNEAFDTLLEMLSTDDARRRGSISWAIQHAIDKRRWKPTSAHRLQLLDYLDQETEDDMCKRCLISIFRKGPLPHAHLGKLADVCIRLINGRKESIAVYSFSMSVFGRIVRLYPELYGEVAGAVAQLAKSESRGVSGSAERLMKIGRLMGQIEP